MLLNLLRAYHRLRFSPQANNDLNLTMSQFPASTAGLPPPIELEVSHVAGISSNEYGLTSAHALARELLLAGPSRQAQSIETIAAIIAVLGALDYNTRGERFSLFTALVAAGIAIQMHRLQ